MYLASKLFFAVIEWFIRGIPSGLGQKVRYAYYKRRFAECGENVRIDEGVTFQNPENIVVGSDVWIMSYSIITATRIDTAYLASNKKIISAKGDRGVMGGGYVKIGNEVQIGLHNILNGIGGIEISNCVTLSAKVSIYSATHMANNPDDHTMRVGANGMVRSRPVFSKQGAIVIGKGVWLGLGSTLICASVGDDSIVHSGALVVDDMAGNKVICGNPAKEVRERFANEKGEA